MSQVQNGQISVDEKTPSTRSAGKEEDDDDDSGGTRASQRTALSKGDDDNNCDAAPAPGDSSTRPSSYNTIPDLEQAVSKSKASTEKQQLVVVPFGIITTGAAPRNLDSIQDDDDARPDGKRQEVETSYPEGGLAAWLVVFGSFIGMTAGFGLMNTVGTFQAYLSTHQLADSSPSLVGWIFSLYIFLAFFCGVQIGPIFDAKGPRWLVFAGSVCLVGGTFAFAESTKLWHFILSFSILCGLGTSLIFTPAVSAIAHWFNHRRAFATGLATTGGSLGGVIFPLMLQRLFPLVGFAWAVRIQAFIFLGLCIVANILIRSRLPAPDPAPTIKDMLPDWRIFRRHWVFILTTAGVFFVEWALFVPLAYISSFALAHNVNSNFAYQILALINGGSFFGRWAPGLIADKFGRFNTMIVTVALCLIAVLAFWLPANYVSTTTSQGQITPLIVVFAVLFGFASGSNISLTPVCVGQLCATEVFGRWYAGLYTVVSFGSLTGLPIAGALVRADGGRYTGLILFTAVSYAAGLGCFVWARVIAVGWAVKRIY